MLANSNSWVSLTQRMFATPRVLITLLAALWLPVCHCQLSMFLFDNVACHDGALKSSVGVSSSVADCCKKVTRSCCAEKSKKTAQENSNSSPKPVCQTCACCVTKAPPPAPPTIDLTAVEFVLPPSLFDFVTAATTIDIPSLELCQHDPPGPPLRVNQRCAIHSHWII